MHGRGHHQGRGCGPGFRGFGRRGFPAREELVERLSAYRDRLEEELANVSDAIERLGAAEPPQGTAQV